MKTPKVQEFAQECAEKAAPMFLVRGRPIKAESLAIDIARRLKEILDNATQASESGGVLLQKDGTGVGVYILVDTFMEDE